MRSLAVIPPLLLDCWQRRIRFINNNGLIEDPMSEFKERQMCNVWTDSERDTFKEKYLQHPKHFSYIAQFLERKVFLVTIAITVINCITRNNILIIFVEC